MLWRFDLKICLLLLLKFHFQRQCVRIHSKNSSCGLRYTTSAVVQIENAESYPAAMRKAGVNVVVEDHKKKL
ncbi:unnamed protein product [Trifolium pratense]|uniref:Uncharacterized protein n=1 Tax=Trifolium pratense TaxID=57577 RepID=A0ACB0K5C0_TRIPR|nr:unnamed protein product [Trifolium pratense]